MALPDIPIEQPTWRFLGIYLPLFSVRRNRFVKSGVIDTIARHLREIVGTFIEL